MYIYIYIYAYIYIYVRLHYVLYDLCSARAHAGAGFVAASTSLYVCM